MKREIRNFKILFEDSINITSLCEEISSLPDSSSDDEIIFKIKETGYDYIPLKNVSMTSIASLDKKGEISRDIITPSDLISYSTSIIIAFKLLISKRRLLVLEGNECHKIITISDLDKAPIRLWVYGNINLLEMALKDAINNCYPGDSWCGFLNTNRLSNAKEMLVKRKGKNLDIDLVSCLQLADVFDIVKSSDKLHYILGKNSKTKYQKLCNKVRDLRDEISHANLITDKFKWEEVLEITDFIKTISDNIYNTTP